MRIIGHEGSRRRLFGAGVSLAVDTCGVVDPASSRAAGSRTSRRIDQRIVSHETTTPISQPMTRLGQRNVQLKKRRRNRRQPPRPQAVNHQPRVEYADDNAERRADRRNDQPSRAATVRSACRPTPTAASVPKLAARCFDAELKQQRDQHHRRGDQEETEAEEQSLERRRAAEAARPCAFTGRNVMPSDAGSIARSRFRNFASPRKRRYRWSEFATS